MYILGIMMITVGIIGILISLIWFIMDRKKSISKDTNLDNIDTNLENKNIIKENICPNCQHTVKKDSKFCANCGQKLF